MPARIKSFGSTFIGTVFISLAAVAINVDSPARAACIEQPPEPAAEPAHVSVPSHIDVHYDYATCHSCHGMAAEALRWTFRYDRAKGRKCWFLLDALGHDVTEAHVQPGAAEQTWTSSLWSKLESWWGNLNLTKTANVEVQSNAPRGTPPHAPRKQGDTVNASGKDGTIRAADKGGDEGRAAKRAIPTLKHEDERALFEEFMQWRERQKVIDSALGAPVPRQ